MSFVTKLVCVQCSAEYADGAGRTCPACGPDHGILDVCYDLERVRRSLTRDALAARTRSHWRYRELLPLDDEHCPTDGHVGWTPLIEAPRLAAALSVRRLRLKDEGRNPSASFKDRASSVGVARAVQEGYTQIACASTGNAASSLACCAAGAGLQANIFVSQIVPEGKLAQLLAFGARVFKIQGTYAQAYDLCTQACEHFGWFNRNAAINPYLVEGKKTGGLEVAEQCADDPPDWVVCSVGDGCSIAGVHKGLVQMRAIGLIDWDARVLGVQAAGVAPLAQMYAEWHGRVGRVSTPGKARLTEPCHPVAQHDPDLSIPTPTGDTYADSINVPVPRNARKALNAVRDSNGAFVTVTDEQIMQAVRETGRLTGVFAEPAAAAAVAGVAQARSEGVIDQDASVVAMITGNGLKDISGARRAVGNPHEISADLDRVIDVVQSAS